MKSRRFIQCDVFSPIPYQGNALAVVVDGEDLSEQQMQLFAAWTNLAETTFLLPPDDPAADYKVRIFTPAREMPFAGHPTLGSCAAWLHSSGMARAPGVVRQECGVGIVEIDVSRRDEDLLAFRAPPTRIQPLPATQFEAFVEALQIPRAAVLHTAQLDNGPVWQVLQLDSAEAVLAVDSARVRWPEFKAIGLIGAHAAGAECEYEVRMLAPSSGMSEDPITGSLNAAIAHWLQAEGRLPGPVTVAQGMAIGRHGRVSIRPGKDVGDIQVGGQTHVLIQGTVTL
jgi:PhzF family phenazine biosynthesis protein